MIYRCLALMLIVVLEAPSVTVGEEVSDERIMDLLSERQFDIKSARFTFYETSMSDVPIAVDDKPREKLDASESAVAELNALVDRIKRIGSTPKRFKLFLESECLRLEERRPCKYSEALDSHDFECIGIYDGAVSKTLVDDTGPHLTEKYGIGTIDREDITNVYKAVSLIPLALSLRPLHWLEQRGFSVSLSKNQRARISEDGDWCVVLEFSDPKTTGLTYQLWLSEEKNATPLRITSRMNDDAGYHIEITNTSTYNNIIVPSSWTFTDFRSNGAFGGGAKKFAVTEAEVNVDISDEVFKLDFPSGTIVTDNSNATNVDRRYIQMENGGVREILPSEWKANVPYQTLRTTVPGPASSVSNLRRSGILLTVVLIAVLLILILQRNRVFSQ